MHQRWEHLLFLHWRLAPEVVQKLLPDGLRVETFDGTAWVGVVPFFMRNIRPWWSPAIRGISNFLELNLRTYMVDPSGRSGVWFFTLDCNQPLAVWWARTWFRLPYFQSRMRAERDPSTGRVKFASHRKKTDPALASRYEYLPNGPLRNARPESLEYFLVERYRLFANVGLGRIAQGEVHHSPYQISDVQLLAWDDHLLRLGGLPACGAWDHAVYSPGATVEVFPLSV